MKKLSQYNKIKSRQIFYFLPRNTEQNSRDEFSQEICNFFLRSCFIAHVNSTLKQNLKKYS